MTELLEEIKRICDPEFYEIGFASLDGLLKKEWSGYPYGVVLARKLDAAIINQIEKGPTLEYFDCYHQINAELNEKVERISSLLRANRIGSHPVKATVTDDELDQEFRKTLRCDFSHKMTATRAGIGWIGKTDLLVTFRFGPRVRLASVLIDRPIAVTGKPVNQSQCGNCHACVLKCPADAATGKLWSIHVDRSEFYDPFKCLDYCRFISKNRIDKEISLCGICMSVCPNGRDRITGGADRPVI